MSSVPLLSSSSIRLSSAVCSALVSIHLQPRKSGRKGNGQSARALLGPDAVFSATTVAVIPLYTLMVGLPRSTITQRVLQPGHFFTAAAALYSVLLVAWWPGGVGQLCKEVFQSCSPLPDVQLLAEAFKCAHVTALAWGHLLLLDIVQAREVWKDGLKHGVATGHSVILCFMFGPLGMLSHMVTRKAFSPQQQRPQSGAPQGAA